MKGFYCLGGRDLSLETPPPLGCALDTRSFFLRRISPSSNPSGGVSGIRKQNSVNIKIFLFRQTSTSARTRRSRPDACKTPNAVTCRLISCANASPDTWATAKSSAKVSAPNRRARHARFGRTVSGGVTGPYSSTMARRLSLGGVQYY